MGILYTSGIEEVKLLYSSNDRMVYNLFIATIHYLDNLKITKDNITVVSNIDLEENSLTSNSNIKTILEKENEYKDILIELLTNHKRIVKSKKSNRNNSNTFNIFDNEFVKAEESLKILPFKSEFISLLIRFNLYGLYSLYNSYGTDGSSGIFSRGQVRDVLRLMTLVYKYIEVNSDNYTYKIINDNTIIETNIRNTKTNSNKINKLTDFTLYNVFRYAVKNNETVTIS
jgi:hypothetical protein